MNQFNKLYNTILESIISQGKEYRINLLKNMGWDEEGLQASLNLLNQFDNKTGDFLAKMIAKSDLKHITDPRIKRVQQIIKLNPSIDTQNYNGSLDQFIQKYQPTIQKSLDRRASKTVKYLDSLPQLSQKKTYDKGVVVYRVQQSEAGMNAVRKIVDDQWGEDADPWCLIARNVNSYDYWKQYNAYPKHIAFQNGKLIAFCAGKNPFVMTWWDRKDNSRYALPLLDGTEMKIDQKYEWSAQEKKQIYLEQHKEDLKYNSETGRYDTKPAAYDIRITDKDLIDGHFPVPFGVIYGDFNCSGCENLTSLFNAPTKVLGDFDCIKCHNLTDIKDIPTDVTGQTTLKYCLKLSFEDRCGLTYNKETGLYDAARRVIINDGDLVDGHFPVKFGKVNGSFSCYSCDSLTSLVGSPKFVDGFFDCGSCYELTTLSGGPEEVVGNFNCNSCGGLTSLIGAPKKVHRNFDCNTCGKLVDLQGAPDIVPGDFDCSFCWNLESLKGAPNVVGGTFNCSSCEKLKNIDDRPKHMDKNKFICNN